MPPQDAEALAELARLCNEARGRLPETDFYRLRVLLDMVLVELGHREPPTRERTVPATSRSRPYDKNGPEGP